MQERQGIKRLRKTQTSKGKSSALYDNIVIELHRKQPDRCAGCSYGHKSSKSFLR